MVGLAINLFLNIFSLGISRHSLSNDNTNRRAVTKTFFALLGRRLTQGLWYNWLIFPSIWLTVYHLVKIVLSARSKVNLICNGALQ